VSDADAWQAWALRLGSVQRRAQDNFLNPGERIGEMRLDFTMWVLRRGDRIIVVDTGFDAAAGARRGRVLDRRPAEAVALLGIDAAEVSTVVVTHLHYDHAGNLGDYPKAEIIVQAKELAYVTGAPMRHPTLNHFFEVDDMLDVVRRVHAGGVRVIDGDLRLDDDLHLCLIGGHTAGLQVVRARTARGWVVIASDAVHYYDNFAERNPFPAIVDLPDMLDGYDRLLELSDGLDHIIPGHDPLVFDRYPIHCGSEHVVALHLPPRNITD
jgi:glyoxylase-like metal-dependent hydrolase (beta-lactamase superfamily II)